MRRALAGVATVCAVAGAAFLGGYAGTHESPPSPPVTVAPPWADGCTTDADCAAMVQAYGGDGLTDEQAEGASVYELALLAEDCEWTGGPDSPPVTVPCLVPVEPFDFDSPDGVVHTGCVVVLVTLEDSTLTCDDDTVWPS